MRHTRLTERDLMGIGTFQEGLQDGHVQVAVLVLIHAEYGQEVRHPNDVLDL